MNTNKNIKLQIWKYQIQGNSHSIEMPMGAQILTVQLQFDKPCIWAVVNPLNDLEERHFEIYGTGQDINCEQSVGFKRKYINTFQINGRRLVFHLFENLKAPVNPLKKDTAIKFPNNDEIQKVIDSLPYYGLCNAEYNEGFKDGVDYIKNLITKSK